MIRFIRNSIILLFIAIPSFGQTSEYKRVEFQSENIYKCIPLYSNGFLLKALDPQKQQSKKIDVYTYEKYDTAFNKVASADVSIPARRSAYIDYTTKTHHYNLAYQISGTYSISVLSFIDMRTSVVQGKLPKNTVIKSMRAVGEYVYLLGYTKDLPILICQNITNNELSFGKIIPLNRRKFSIVSFEVNEDTNEVYLFTMDELKFDRMVKMYIYKDGAKVHETIIKMNDPEKYIVSAFASRLQDGSCIISGTYGNTQKSTDASVGIFIMKQDNEGQYEYTKYINYLDINNFTSYLSVHKQEKIEKKQEKKQTQNKELEINYLMAPHKIIEQDGEYVLVGEAYYPTFQQRCEYIHGPSGSTMYCYQVFDGYQYTHFFVLGFNEFGELLWSNSAPMDIDEKPYNVMKYLSVNHNKPNVQLMYSTWNKIFLYNYNNGENVQQEEISFVSDEEKLVSSSSKCRYWYENNFICYGTQKIKNKEDKAKRDIFFVEKIEISNQ